MNVKHFVIAVGLGLGLSLALLWALGGAAIPIVAAPAPRALSDATPVHYVAITGTDSGDCSTPAGACRAVQYAVDRAGEGDEVRVATGVYTGVSVRPRADVTTTGFVTQVVYITKTLTVRGGYTTTNWSVSNPISHPTTLDAQGQGRVLYVTGDVSPTIEGLRITGGDANGLGGSTWWGDFGGGVYIVTATVTLDDNDVYDNVADYGAGLSLHASASVLNANTVTTNSTQFSGGGGGLYLDASPASLNQNTIRDNSGLSGGGLYLYLSAARLSDNLISGNSGFSGGGLYVFSSTATLDANAVLSNTASEGGGLHLASSAATLTGNTVGGNTASDDGGGLYISSSDAALSGNTISDNTVANKDGGGLHLFRSNATLSENNIFSNTSSRFGGGLFLNDSDPTINNNTFYSNTAFVGGGLFMVNSDPTLSADTFTHNSADFGAGLAILDSQGTLVNNIVADNQASVNSAGMSINGSSTRLLHTTVARNRGGSGVYVSSGVSYGNVTLTNTILVSHTVGISTSAGNTVTLQATLWGSDAWANDTDWGGAGAILTGTHNYWGDPAFLDPDAGNYHIGPGSAALDKGVDTGVATDVDGEPRLSQSPDLGADEYWPPGVFRYIYLPLVLKNGS